jgi:hypothetical protein
MNQGNSSGEERRGKRLYLKPHPQAKKRDWTWQRLGALFGLVSGIIAIIFGSIFTAISWFAESEATGSFLRRYATIIFLLAIPLLILGAHCLDLSERNR